MYASVLRPMYLANSTTWAWCTFELRIIYFTAWLNVHFAIRPASMSEALMWMPSHRLATLTLPPLSGLLADRKFTPRLVSD